MLWVTITIVTCDASSSTVSSIRRVEVGSSAEQGSSISSTSGAHGQRAGDAEPLLLAARERAAGLAEPVLDLVPQARARVRHCSTSASSLRTRLPDRARPGDDVLGRCSWPGTGSASGTPCRSACGPRWGAGRRRRCRRRRDSTEPDSAAPGHQLVHPVQDAQERRLAAARRARSGRSRGWRACAARPARAPCGRPNHALTPSATRSFGPVAATRGACVLDGYGFGCAHRSPPSRQPPGRLMGRAARPGGVADQPGDREQDQHHHHQHQAARPARCWR